MLVAVGACAALALGYVLLETMLPAATREPTRPENEVESKPEKAPEPEKAPAQPAEPEKAPEKKPSEKAAEKKLPEESKEEQAPPPPAPEESCDDLRVLVDRNHTLPLHYAPRDLVSLRAYGVPVLRGGSPLLLRREAARHLRDLVRAATADGEELVVASAYRSYAQQKATYAEFSAIYGEGAGSVSAPPGQSQHQLGTAVDFTNAAADYRLWWPFGDTSASAWLVENAPDYGFVLAYPSGKEHQTGYQYEPWHYRYIGTQNAARMKQSDLSLQAFLTREGVVPRC